MNTLKEFLETGNLNGIKKGLTPQQVKDIMGSDPEGTHNAKHTLAYQYGALELFFSPNTGSMNICLILLNIWNEKRVFLIPKKIQFSDTTPKIYLKENFLKYIKDNDIKPKKEDQDSIRFDHNISVFFDEYTKRVVKIIL